MPLSQSFLRSHTTMGSRLPSCLRSGDYAIHALLNRPLGKVCIGGAMQNVPVIVPSPGGYPQKFHVELVDESNHVYVITVDGKNIRDDKHLVYASDREAQRWVITYWKQQDAYIIAKLHTQEAWTEPDQGRRRDSNDARQIRLKPLVAMNQGTCCRIHPSQLFRFKPLRGHKLPNGNYKIRSLVSNQPLGVQPIVGRRPAYPAVVPVAGVAPRMFRLQQVNGSEDTYLIRLQGRYIRAEGNLFQSPPAQQWVITRRQQPDAYT
ncbi:hypothetical protein EDC04DRAFT_1635196 [Pisolithus marmoratus]|nr:hypothetical protein EDC04DRAFT_1635196 [Pisolithus marmoratus]